MAAPVLPPHAQPNSSKAQAWGWAEAFVISQTALPAILYFPGTQSIRPLARIGAFAISLLILLVVIVRRNLLPRQLSPAFGPLKICLAFLTLMIFHPDTVSLTVGVAAVGFFVAILAPLIWVPALVHSVSQLRRLLWILLICNGVNSLVGILQAENPARWMPAEFSRLVAGSNYGLDIATYKGANDQTMIRPPGLFDTPGAVAGPGLLAGFLGLALSIGSKSQVSKLMAAALGFCGITVIYLTLVRSSLLVLTVMLGTYILLRRFVGSNQRTPHLILLTVGVFAAGFQLASQYGGETIHDRFSTIVEEKPTEFYYRSRGIEVEYGFKELLPKYPLGAGLGRWGMVSHYVGAQTVEGAMGADTQFPAWIIDGGAVLLFGYCLAIWKAWSWLLQRAKNTSDEQLRALAVLVLAVMAGMFIHCFSFPVFSTQIGLQFWFLIGASYGAIIHSIPQEPSDARARKQVPRIGRRF